MNLVILFCAFLIINLLDRAYGYSEELEKPPEDYDFQWVREQAGNLRKFSHDRKTRPKKTRITDRHFTNNTVFAEGISHFDISKGQARWKQVNEIENDFKRLLAMKGVKYIYKRDAYWRTWREIKDKNGNGTVVCYKCENTVNVTCKDCLGRGFWVIEDRPPPCPYEIFSLMDDDEICAANYTQFNKTLDKCPSKIKFADLSGTCTNPIETSWRFTKVHDKVSERESSVICGEREICEILTVYTISPDQVVFRIVDKHDHVLYSRVMKNGGKNYACIENCGRMDRNKLKLLLKDIHVTKSDLPAPDSYKKKKENTKKVPIFFNTSSAIIAPKTSIFSTKNILFDHNIFRLLSNKHY